MKIKAQDFVDTIEADKYLKTTIKKTASQITASSLEKQMQPLFDAIAEALNTGHLAQAELTVTGKVTAVYRIETGIINLPFENSKRIFQFFDLTQEVPVVINLITASEDLNASGLRIDTMGTSDEFLDDQATIQAKILLQAQEQWAYLAEHHGEGKLRKEAAATRAKTTTVKKSAGKTTTKKTTAKKTTVKQRTTRKKTTATVKSTKAKVTRTTKRRTSKSK